MLAFWGGACGKEPASQCRRCKRYEFDPGVRKILWRRKWQPTPVFLPGNVHGQRNTSMSHKESGITEHTHTHTHTHTLCLSLLLVLWGFLGFTVIKNLPVNAGDTRDSGLISGSGRSLWNRKCQPTPIFLPGESHGQRSLVGYSPWVTKSQTLLSIHACILVLNYSINMKV